MGFRYFGIINGLLQVVGWLLFIGIPLLEHVNRDDFWSHFSVLQFGLQHFWLMALFYWNYLYLVPVVLEKRGLAVYLWSLLLTAALTLLLINGSTLIGVLTGHPFRFRLNAVVPIIQLVAASSAWRLLADFFRFRLRENKLREEKKQADLKFLRSQINPHFLFNTLNNIIAQIRTNPSEAERSVVRLSNLMRYVLNSGKLDQVSLENELAYIRNYVDLQKIRLNKEFDLRIELPEHAEGVWIEPLLLIGFIENTFKHGIHGEEEDFIEIRVWLSGKQLSLLTRNRLQNDSSLREIESGVGLDNVKRRLEICYPKRYELDISTSGDIYMLRLKLEL